MNTDDIFKPLRDEEINALKQDRNNVNYHLNKLQTPQCYAKIYDEAIKHQVPGLKNGVVFYDVDEERIVGHSLGQNESLPDYSGLIYLWEIDKDWDIVIDEIEPNNENYKGFLSDLEKETGVKVEDIDIAFDDDFIAWYEEEYPDAFYKVLTEWEDAIRDEMIYYGYLAEAIDWDYVKKEIKSYLRKRGE